MGLGLGWCRCLLAGPFDFVLIDLCGACEAAPVTNRLFPPVEIIGGTLELTFSDASRSERRPPHPLFAEDVLEIDACH